LYLCEKYSDNPAAAIHQLNPGTAIVNAQISNKTLLDSLVIYDKENDTLVYDRKLKDGPGNSMYGLEVCKSLGLPQDFLDKAYEIRMKYHPENASILSLKTSHYNSKKVVGMCEKCGWRGKGRVGAIVATTSRCRKYQR
jgi:DNA mismatch repair ATPase MutS